MLINAQRGIEKEKSILHAKKPPRVTHDFIIIIITTTGFWKLYTNDRREGALIFVDV